MGMVKQRIINNLGIYIGISAALILVYYPVFTFDYLFHDDVYFFARHTGQFAAYLGFDVIFAIGRFLAAYYFTFLGYVIDSLLDLRAMRFAQIILLGICAFFVYLRFYNLFESKIASGISALMVFLLPPFQVAVSYAGSAHVIPAVLLSIVAFEFVVRGGKGMFNKSQIIAILFLIMAICFYQSSAMFYWFLVALFIMSIKGEIKSKDVYSIIRQFFVGILAMIIYAGILMLLRKQQIGLTRSIYNPYDISFDLIGKIKWFISEPLFNALNLWNIFPETLMPKIIVSGVLLALLVSGIRIFFGGFGQSDRRRKLLQGIVRIFLICLLTVLCYLPNLVAKGNAPWYRTMAALSPTVLLTVLWAFQTVIIELPLKFRKFSSLFVLSSVLIFAGLIAYHNILYYRVLPSHFEVEYVKKIFSEANIKNYNRIHVVGIQDQQLSSRYDEFGVLTSHYGFDLKLLTRCAAREVGKEEDLFRYDIQFSYSLPGQLAAFSEPTLIIDMNDFVEKYRSIYHGAI